MFSRQCPFCENVNPPNSRFCNACGVQLRAALCPHCGAVNVVTATACVNCAELLEAVLDTAVCPQCGAVNAAAATVCVKCHARLPETAIPEPAAAPKVGGRPAARASATQVVPQRAGQPGDAPSVAAAAGKPVLPIAGAHAGPELHGPAERAIGAAAPDPHVAFSVHFERDDSVKIDRYDLDAMHSSLSEGGTARAAVPVLESVDASTPSAELNGWAAHESDRYEYSVSPVVHHGNLPADPPASLPRNAVLIGVAVVGLLAGSVYYLYSEHSRATTTALLSSGGQPTPPDRSRDANAAPAREANEGAAAANTEPPAAPNPPSQVAPAAQMPAPITAPAAQTPVPTSPPALATRQVPTKEAAAAVAAAVTRPKAANASSTGQPQPAAPCTDAVVALGLCTQSTTPRRQ